MLFSGDAGQRLEPVREVRRAVSDRPIFHRFGHRVGHANVQFFAFVDRLAKGLVDLFRKGCPHYAIIKNQTSEVI